MDGGTNINQCEVFFSSPRSLTPATIMADNNTQDTSFQILSTKGWLSQAQGLVPRALAVAKEVSVFPQKWKLIIWRLQHIPSRLSDLSSHPCFPKNSLCKEQLEAITHTLNETIELAKSCADEKYEGKLKMQRNLDAVIGKLDISLRGCGLLIKTSLLAEVTYSSEVSTNENVRELLARLPIRDLESRHKALDGLVDIIKEDEKKLFEK